LFLQELSIFALRSRSAEALRRSDAQSARECLDHDDFRCWSLIGRPNDQDGTSGRLDAAAKT